jgi:hypothetical protein
LKKFNSVLLPSLGRKFISEKNSLISGRYVFYLFLWKLANILQHIESSRQISLLFPPKKPTAVSAVGFFLGQII